MMVIEPLHALILGEIQRASDSRIAYPAAWSEEKFSASGRFILPEVCQKEPTIVNSHRSTDRPFPVPRES
jgi:hypothetical protein